MEDRPQGRSPREAWAENHPGDRDDLDLLGNQDDLVKAIRATGKPIVVMLLNGRPNSINYIAQDVPAIGTEGQTQVSVDVTNTGTVRGDEVVQLHIRDEVSSVTRPVKELRGFQRVTLNPGETRTVQFALGMAELSFLNRDMRRVVEPGTFRIMVGGNSVDLIDTKLEVVTR
jgi:hypothetical protein